MQALNRRFRQKNKATDVLSFPSPTKGMAGDIAISLEIAASNAEALGHPLATEVKILILHGLLHLAGYDHEIDDGEMRAREAELRREFKLPVGLIERGQVSSTKGRPSGLPGSRSPKRGDRTRMSLCRYPSCWFFCWLLLYAGVVRGPALSRDGQISLARISGKHRSLRAARGAAAGVHPRACVPLYGDADARSAWQPSACSLATCCLSTTRWVALDLLQAAVSLIFIIVIFSRLLPHIFFVRTRGVWLAKFVPILRHSSTSPCPPP